MNGLTDAKIKAISAPTTGRLEFIDDKVPGLRLRVSATGLKSFVVRKRVHGGRVQVITLGTYSATRFDLTAARKKARTIISDLEAGKPAPKVRAVNSKSLTINRLLPDFYKAKAGNRSLDLTKRQFDLRIIPEFGDRLADTITRGEITRFLDDIEKPSVARTTFVALSSFYSWAMPRLDHLPANPCRDATKPKPLPSRERVLSDDEFAALWIAADDLGYPFGTGIKLLMLTAARRAEVFHAAWDEFDLKAKVWTIPGERSKNGLAHTLPLCDQAIAILKAMPRFAVKAEKAGEAEKAKPILFPARGTGRPFTAYSKGAAALRKALDKELGRAALDWRVHDIRRTGATTLQRLGVSLPVIEAILNHLSGSRGGLIGTYQRHSFTDEKRAALELLGQEIERLVSARKEA